MISTYKSVLTTIFARNDRDVFKSKHTAFIPRLEKVLNQMRSESIFDKYYSQAIESY